MSKSPSKKSDIRALSHIATSVERHTSVADSACDVQQNSSDSIPPRTRFPSAALPDSSLQGTCVD